MLPYTRPSNIVTYIRDNILVFALFKIIIKHSMLASAYIVYPGRVSITTRSILYEQFKYIRQFISAMYELKMFTTNNTFWFWIKSQKNVTTKLWQCDNICSRRFVVVVNVRFIEKYNWWFFSFSFFINNIETSNVAYRIDAFLFFFFPLQNGYFFFLSI